jgi:hypothetical protein
MNIMWRLTATGTALILGGLTLFLTPLGAQVQPRPHPLEFVCPLYVEVVNGVNTGTITCPADPSPLILRQISVRVNTPRNQHISVGIGTTGKIIWCNPLDFVGTTGSNEDVYICSLPVYFPLSANAAAQLYVAQVGANSGVTVVQMTVTGERR